MTENLLKYETSPYLLQHKNNPVHWYPWGDQAFNSAKLLDKPILLSIGYAACHWCHVMAHESFEDQNTADVMNNAFINIKIDREEYPDVDKLYMDAIHALGERGGWPLTVFLEPDGTPFWGGTYFPKTPQYGRPCFVQVLDALHTTWNTQRHKITNNKSTILSALKSTQELGKSDQPLDRKILLITADQIVSRTDKSNGGLSGAPKFPQTIIYNFLWRMYLETADEKYQRCVVNTLVHICQGGIYDHLGGGFARYSVDDRWLAPHFEKMLYDNALLIDLLTTVNKSEDNNLFRVRIKETVNWLISHMKKPDSTFGSSYDADSEGQEGTFYVWSSQELTSVIPLENQDLFFRTYDVAKDGNWEGKIILNRLHSLQELSPQEELELQKIKSLLVQQRSLRENPGWDDKTLTDWNALAITAICNAGIALQRNDWIEVAQTTYTQLLKILWCENNLKHSFRNGKAINFATAEDYANLIGSSLCLYEATNNSSFLDDACLLTEQMTKNHWNLKDGGYYFSSVKSKNLLLRTSHGHDDVTPNANGTMISNLMKLYFLTGKQAYEKSAKAILQAFTANTMTSPMAYTGLLNGFLNIIEHYQAVLIIPKGTTNDTNYNRLIKRSKFPLTVIILTDGQSLPNDHPAIGKTAVDNQPTLYLCKGKVCSQPIIDFSIIDQNINDQLA